MVLLQSQQGLVCSQENEAVCQVSEFVRDQKRFALLLLNSDPSGDDTALSIVGQSVLSKEGQFLSLNMADLLEKRFSGQLLAAMDDLSDKKSFQINLPLILKDNPHSDSPFINRAIIWQRLCDRMIEDENEERPTLFVLENIDCANWNDQHDVARLIRFHNTHRIRRSFVATLQKQHYENLKPELLELAELIIEIQ